MDRDQFWLEEGQFARLAPHLPTDTRKPRVRASLKLVTTRFLPSSYEGIANELC